ncbi:broad-complex core protein isoforms 1/2/3/4/5 isoform X5 [Hermetia illucens]|uniref:broad-complex core protein isoforms 1/2/3/4/5 isoform X5 n=1 Tax=Hermetia illucens TaxID=343691 RepID=UPI0018CC02B9|nr:broad-complex core protein isoforms 1/2/3/4/5 isoform X5 [Hermetia illucens]
MFTESDMDEDYADKTPKMVDTQHFCLRWNNYQSSITSAFENLRDDEDFVDVTLACDGRSLKAHRVVLSACSPYFRELLKSTPCKHPVIVLQDVSFPDLHALVEFIYHGEVNVHQRSLSSFLKTAEVLRVSGLTQQQAEETNSQLAQIQNLANSGGRTSINHHSFSDKLHDDPPLFPQGASPPPHLNSLHPSLPNSSVNQLLRRAAAAAAFRRDRQNSNQSDDLSLKRHRPDNGLSGNNNSPDVTSHMPQVTAADFSTIKHNNNNTPPLKDDKCEKNDDFYSIEGNGQTGNGNGLSNVDKDSLTPSPTSRTADDVKSEPMELVCSNNNPQSDEHSNDSTGDIDPNRSSSVGDGKGSLSSANDDEIENSIHSHPPPPFLMSPADSKLFPTPGSYNFSMAALTDATLQGFSSQLQSAAELAGSPQAGPQNAVASANTSSSSTNSTSSTSPISPNSSGSGQLLGGAPSSGRLTPTSNQSQQQQQAINSLGVTGTNHHHPLRIPPPTSGGINEPQECPYCRRTFSCYYSLKRHFQDKHEQSDTLYVCEFCHRRYRTKNSLTTHKSLQHRGSSGMLKRLLKTSAIKNVLGPHHPITHQRPHLFDFASELGQPPPGIQ